jgi:phage terminase small subunit
MPRKKNDTKKRRLEIRTQQRIFAENYLLTGSAPKAAKAAGYAASHGSRLLKDKRVVKYIEDNKNEISEIVGISKIMTLKSLKDKAFASITDVFNDDWTLKPLSEMRPEIRAAIKEIYIKDGEIKVVLHDQLKAGDMILKSMGWNEPEKIENTIKQDAPLIIQIDNEQLDL